MLDSTDNETLPEIPAKRYFTIGEVSKLCRLKAHVLRHWEREFEHLSPAKRRGNRRYYQRHEVEFIRKIRELLYVEGYTTNGARARIEQLIDSGEIVLKDVSAKRVKTQKAKFPKEVESNAPFSDGARSSDSANKEIEDRILNGSNQSLQKSSDNETSELKTLENLLVELKSIRASLEK